MPELAKVQSLTMTKCQFYSTALTERFSPAEVEAWSRHPFGRGDMEVCAAGKGSG